MSDSDLTRERSELPSRFNATPTVLEVAVRLDYDELALLRAGLHHLSSIDFNALDEKLKSAQTQLSTAVQAAD